MLHLPLRMFYCGDGTPRVSRIYFFHPPIIRVGSKLSFSFLRDVSREPPILNRKTPTMAPRRRLSLATYLFTLQVNLHNSSLFYFQPSLKFTWRVNIGLSVKIWKIGENIAPSRQSWDCRSMISWRRVGFWRIMGNQYATGVEESNLNAEISMRIQFSSAHHAMLHTKQQHCEETKGWRAR